MKLAVVCLIAFAAIALPTLGYPTTNGIQETVGQLKCASDAIHELNAKYNLGDSWFMLDFPLAMHVSTIFGCEAAGEKDLINECVAEEMASADMTFIEYLQYVRKDNVKASEEIYEALTEQCHMELMTLEEMDLLPEIDFNRISFKKYLNIEHIRCVITAITKGVARNGLALEWAVYSSELAESITHMMVCREYHTAQRNICYANEAQSVARTLMNFWKFLSQKKHIQLIREVKQVVHTECPTQKSYF